MPLTQTEDYHGRPSPRGLRRHGRGDTSILTVIGDREFPDVTITGDEKRAIRAEIRAAAVDRSVHACMYAAGAWEDEARAKRDEEQREAAS